MRNHLGAIVFGLVVSIPWWLGAIQVALAHAEIKPKHETVYRLTKQGNDFEIGITCRNGADPTGTKLGEMVVISCGK